MIDEGLPKIVKQCTRQVYGVRPDSGLYPVGIDNPFNALDFREPSLIQNPQAGCLASTDEELNQSQRFSELDNFT